MKTIAVIFGGKSVEHDISVITAMQAMARFPKGYQMLPIYITSQGNFVVADNLNDAKIYLNFAKNVKNCRNVSIDFENHGVFVWKKNKIKKRIKVDCALLCNHGHGGEDGTLQGMLELAGIAYTSSTLSSSAMTMDKSLTKIMLGNFYIKTLPYVQFDRCEYHQNKLKILQTIKKKLAFPCIIKPANLGSSVGISICECEAKLDKQIEDAFAFDERILVERYLSDAEEYSCACVKINDKILPSKVNKVKKSKIYTFEEKYIKEREIGKCEISKELNEQIKKLAVKAYKALRCDGVVRIDFLLDKKKKTLFVNEINSIPGSLSFNMFDSSFEDLLSVLIEEGIEKNGKTKNVIYQFSSSAIEKYISLSCKKGLKAK